MRKRILGMLLSVAMVVGLINVPVMAADAVPDYIISTNSTTATDVDKEIIIPPQ